MSDLTTLNHESNMITAPKGEILVNLRPNTEGDYAVITVHTDISVPISLIHELCNNFTERHTCPEDGELILDATWMITTTDGGGMEIGKHVKLSVTTLSYSEDYYIYNDEKEVVSWNPKTPTEFVKQYHYTAYNKCLKA